MKINWNNIGAIDGQREGFEELVCQLASKEKIPNQKKFIRIGKPDGGKECYWELGDGSLHCWQAKFFLYSFKANEWSQVNKSVKDAINNHPNLRTYYVVVPVDRPDGKGKGKSMLQKWKSKVSEWEDYAAEKGMTVTFEYWGKHELETRLRKRENEGLLYYFFNQEEFLDDWFDRKNQESINALGSRYSPELNFELPIAEIFHGFSRGTNFVQRMNKQFDELLEKFKTIKVSSKEEVIKANYQNLAEIIIGFRSYFESITFSGISSIPYQSLKDILDEIYDCIEDLQRLYHSLREEENKGKGQKEDRYPGQPYSNELHHLRELRTKVYRFSSYLESTSCQLANKPYLILTGPAGIGKSHLLTDVLRVRKEKDHLSLMLLGENFSTREMPWTQILNNQLRKPIDEYSFLGALNAKAESCRSRIVIFIDALNEGEGRLVWPKRLKSFIYSFEDFPWLGLCVSIRSSFEQLIAPKKTIDETIASRVEHPGFESLEYEASSHFFEYYGIIPPDVPLLNPEFQTPLFLKLFCEGLAKRGLKQIPLGYEGITSIIEYYIESVDIKLSHPDQLDYDPDLRLVKKVVHEILKLFVERGQDHLSYDEAETIVGELFQGKCGNNNRQYLKRLISEGVLNKDLYWDQDHNNYYGIHFAYQRFQDHLMTSALLGENLDLEDPIQSFKKGKLKELLLDGETAYYNQNLIEALSIQIPERVGKELHEVAPYAGRYPSVTYAFIDSLIWRRPDTIGENARKYVNLVLRKNKEVFYRFLDTTLSTSMRPDFYFNADSLHRTLSSFSLPERDAWWTTWLQDKYEDQHQPSSVKRLIDWAWSEKSHSHISDEVVRLASIALGWFLASSNRYLRDAATKALVSLLQDRLPVLIEVLKAFAKVNDPYVYERLFAVAYGCALRTKNQGHLIALSEYTYQSIFDVEEVYPHILLRDYARGIIEYTFHLNLALTLKVEKIRPPYKSILPKSFPTNIDIDKKYGPKNEDGNYGGKNWGSGAIIRSMTTEYGRGTGGYGDFGRYVFQSAFSDWEVDYKGLSNYAVQRIFELGYDSKLFNEFDLKQGSGRGASHNERIGKKYQWIVFYELLAKVADNCQLYDESSLGRNAAFDTFEGPWRPYVRDIDPSMVIRDTKRTNQINKLKSPPWWFTVSYNHWEPEPGSWLKDTSDLPVMEKLLIVQDKEGTEWINLQMKPAWKEPKKRDEASFSANGKRIPYFIGSWLVSPSDLKKMLKIESPDYIWGDWFPELSNRYEVFSREFSWSQAWEFFDFNPYYRAQGLPQTIIDPITNEEIATVYHTASNFLWEEEFDCSKEEAIRFFKPTKLIANGLKYAREEGVLINKQGEVICYDPSIYEEGPSCLLIRKDHLQELLKELKLQLVWVAQGEKQILGASRRDLPSVEHLINGIFYLNGNGNLQGKAKSYIRDFSK